MYEKGIPRAEKNGHKIRRSVHKTGYRSRNIGILKDMIG